MTRSNRDPLYDRQRFTAEVITMLFDCIFGFRLDCGCLCSEGMEGRSRQERVCYTKAGIILDDLIPAELAPVDLFVHKQEKSGRLSSALDAVNDRWGKETLIVVPEGF
jgi:hypothetical protein